MSHKHVTLNKEQTEQLNKMARTLHEHASRVHALSASVFKEQGVEREIDTPLGKAIMIVPNGEVDVCQHCGWMLVHMLRETADMYEDIFRKFDVKEPVFVNDEWQRKGK